MKFPNINYKVRISTYAVAALVVLFLHANSILAQKDVVTVQSSVAPVFVSGNPSCSSLIGNASVGTVFLDSELKLDFASPNGTFAFVNNPPNQQLIGPGDASRSITINSTARTLNWNSTMGVTAVIVKGGPNANVYPYSPTSFGDAGLTTPGGGFDISHVSICYAIPARVAIRKVANTIDGSGSAITPFSFTSSPNLGTTSFSLVDDNAGPGTDTFQNLAIWDFYSANAISVQENMTLGWTLADIQCIEDDVSDSVVDFANRSVTLIAQQGETITCTFTNSQLTITAAPATITGQVLHQDGSAIRGVLVTLQDLSTGEVRTVPTNTFGYYTFNELPVGDFYRVTVSSRKYNFRDSVRSFLLTEDLAGLNFIAEE